MSNHQILLRYNSAGSRFSKVVLISLKLEFGISLWIVKIDSPLSPSAATINGILKNPAALTQQYSPPWFKIETCSPAHDGDF